MTQILLRYDDFSTSSNSVIERRLFETVANRGAKLTVSIVPFVAGIEWPPRGPIPLLPLSSEKVALFKEFAPCLDPVLHGYAHQAVSRYTGLSEFNYASPTTQKIARLRDGKAYLEELLRMKIRTFVPPWNAYSADTLEALAATGFEAVSGDASFGPLCSNMAFIPSTCLLPEIPTSLAAAAGDSGSLVCALLHEYDFPESGSVQACITMEQLGEIIDRAIAQKVTWAHFGDCMSSPVWGMERAKANQDLRTALRSPFRRLLKRGTRGVYWSTENALRKERLIRCFNRLKP